MELVLILIFVLLKFSKVPGPPFQNLAYATGCAKVIVQLFGFLFLFSSFFGSHA